MFEVVKQISQLSEFQFSKDGKNISEIQNLVQGYRSDDPIRRISHISR